MPKALSGLFGRTRARHTPARSFTDRIRRIILLAPSEGSADRLLEHMLKTFSDDMIVEIYAGDIRLALQAARDDTTFVHPDRFRIDFDWETGRLSATDGRARLSAAERTGLLQTAEYVLGRIRQDDLRAIRANKGAKRGLYCCRVEHSRGDACPICDPD
ncbi:hypothetical protein [Sphingomonas sp. UYP23]